MAKLTRKLQKIFGGVLAPTNEIAAFGSMKADGVATYSTDVATLQTDEWESGWKAAVVGNNAPFIQDMNGCWYVTTKQLAYLFQKGVPEWIATETYYIGGHVSSTDGKNIFASVVDDSLNQATTLGSKWQPIVQTGVVDATGPTTTIDCQLGKVFNVAGGAGGNKTFTIANMYDGQRIEIIVNGANTNTISWTLTTAAAPGGTSLTLKTGTGYSGTMTSAVSKIVLLRYGAYVIAESYHGMA